MAFPPDEVDELKQVSPNAAVCDEGGVKFILLPQISMPEGCTPSTLDLLLCPTPRDGYHSRLFFSERVEPAPKAGRGGFNWNGAVRVAERNWCAFSWQTRPGLRLAQMLAAHLRALR